jgi:hypothetical protein
MELPGTAYLYTLATLAVSFVGFSALVIMLRQAFGGGLSKLEILITRIFIQLGFIVAAGAILPPLMSLFGWPIPVIWRLCSLVTAVPSFLFAVTYPSRRRVASGVPTPITIWVDVLILTFIAIMLFCSAFGFGVGAGPGPYAASLTFILFLSGYAYLQALNLLLRGHLDGVEEKRRA